MRQAAWLPSRGSCKQKKLRSAQGAAAKAGDTVVRQVIGCLSAELQTLVTCDCTGAATATAAAAAACRGPARRALQRLRSWRRGSRCCTRSPTCSPARGWRCRWGAPPRCSAAPLIHSLQSSLPSMSRTFC